MLDLTQLKKRYFEVKIGTQILKLNPPKLKTFQSLLSIASSLQSYEEDGNSEQLHELSGLLAKLLSNNQQGKKISEEFVAEQIDLDMMILFFEQYMEWIEGVKQDPNSGSRTIPQKTGKRRGNTK